MPVAAAEFDAALSEMRSSADRLRELMVSAAAQDIVATAAEFAPGEEDFRTAIHAPGPGGDHALIAVEDGIAGIVGRNPVAIDVMRTSIEWDDEVRKDSASKAALAVVNEALGAAEELWSERPDPKGPAPR